MKLILDESKVNKEVIATMERTLDLAMFASSVDICFRANGETLCFEADWLKYLSQQQESE